MANKIEQIAKKKTIAVSDLFKEIYINFNVFGLADKMQKLEKRELYLLLTLALDMHSDKNHAVVNNFQPFKDEMMEIYELQDDKETNNQVLLDLIEETGDKYIETENIVDSEGNKMRKPYTKQEARQARINIISDIE